MQDSEDPLSSRTSAHSLSRVPFLFILAFYGSYEPDFLADVRPLSKLISARLLFVPPAETTRRDRHVFPSIIGKLLRSSVSIGISGVNSELRYTTLGKEAIMGSRRLKRNFYIIRPGFNGIPSERIRYIRCRIRRRSERSLATRDWITRISDYHIE